MQHPKVVVIGAGSLFFGRQAIWQMVHSPHLNKGTLALVDIDPVRLDKMARLARKVVAHAGAPLEIEASTHHKDVLKGADFVVLSFAKDSVRYRGIDCQVSLKYGIRMCSGDTIGPGGIFRTLREFPVILQIARDMESICPDAWAINYINPTSAHGLGLRKYAPGLKSFALCDGPHMPHIKRRYALRGGIIRNDAEYTDEIAAKFDYRAAGVNHFTWLIKAEYEGRDLMKPIAEWLRNEAASETDGGDTGAKKKHNNAIGYQLYQIFGIVPTCVAHTKEYVRFWQGLGKSPEPIPPLAIWETAERYKRHEDMWKQVDSFLDGSTPIDTYMATFKPDHATDIIENIVGSLGKTFYLNTANEGSVPNMQPGAFLELPCKVDAGGIKVLPVGEFPAGIRGLQNQVLDAHELAVDAAVSGRRDVLLQAMMTDPMVSSIADANAIIDELTVAEKEMMPKGLLKN
ncbi:MAG: glycoside hydrolase family 4 [Phycisphaerae bacterium]|jgi:alpha-galactosidase